MKIFPGVGRCACVAALEVMAGIPIRIVGQAAPPDSVGDPNAQQVAAGQTGDPNSQQTANGQTAASSPQAATSPGSGAAGGVAAMSPEEAAAAMAALAGQQTSADQFLAMQAAAAGVPFGVTPQAAKPFMTVTFHYYFSAPVAPTQGTYYVNCMRADLPDNSPDHLGQKNLNAEWHNKAIAGTYTLQLPSFASLSGNYSFRIFGPYLAHVDKSTLPSPVPIPPGMFWVDVVQHGKLFKEGPFTFGAYQTVLTVPAEVPPRRRMTITWADASVHQDAGIGLFKSGTDNQHPIARMKFANLPGSWEVDAPAELGSYEVRAFLSGGSDTTGTRPFKVTWGTAQPVLSGFPATCYPFAYMPIDFANSPPEINAWIGIFEVTNTGTNTGWSWQDLQGKTSGEIYLSAPATSGRYDIRLLDSSNNLLARSGAFQVVAGSKTVQLQAVGEAGHVKLTWNNPVGYQSLDGYFVYRGTAVGAESATPLTVGPIPADRSAAAATTVNVHLDGDVQPGTKYYYIVKPLEMDHVTLGATSNETSVTVETPAQVAGGSGGAGQPSTAVAASTPSSGTTSVVAPAVASAGTAATSATPAAAQAGAGTSGAARRQSGDRHVTMVTDQDGPQAPAAGAAAPGVTAEFTKARRLGETDALVFALKSAEYEAGRLTFGDDWVTPQAGEKFLVVHFQVTNPRRQAVQFNAGRFRWTVVDAQGAAINAAERIGLEADPNTMEQTLPPGGAVDGWTVFRVPAAGAMQSITVGNPTDTGLATARISLGGQVRALPARYAGRSDGAGATVAEVVAVRKGETFPCGRFDVAVESIETIGADSDAGSANEAGLPVYATVRYTLRDVHAAGVFGAGAPVVTVIDAQGGAHPAELQTFETKEPEPTDLLLKPGETAEFRLRCWVPQGTTPRQVVFQELGGIPVCVDVTQ